MSPREDEPLGRHLADPFSEETIAHTWTQVGRGRAARRARRERIRVALAAAAVVVIALGSLALRTSEPAPTPPGPITLAGGGTLASLGADELVVLDEGSRIATGPATWLELLQNQPGLLTFHLARGRARFEITPHGPRTWRVEGSGVEVEVVGTMFEIERDGERVRVSVERGAVLVRGRNVPDGVRRLDAGQSLWVEPPAAVAPPPEPAPAPPAPETTPPAAEARRERARPPRVDPTRAALELADELRRAGDDTGAIAVLRGLVAEHPRSAEAPIAAFTAAQLLARRGDTAAARQLYERALELGLSGTLAEDARDALGEEHAP